MAYCTLTFIVVLVINDYNITIPRLTIITLYCCRGVSLQVYLSYFRKWRTPSYASSTQMLLDIVSRPSSSPPKRPGTTGRKERSSPTPHRSCSTRPRPWPTPRSFFEQKASPLHRVSCVWESWWFHSASMEMHRSTGSWPTMWAT